MVNSEYPLKHLSVRVPWHDAGWNGTVCNAPELNGACVKLNKIAGRKDDEREKRNAGKFLKDIPNQEEFPPCIRENATFMANFDMDYEKSHPSHSPYHEHLVPTPQHYPKFSAPVVPFRWMRLDMFGELQKKYDLYDIEVDESREPDLPYETRWANEAENQEALLNAFSAHLQEEDSLCFFYAQYVPFIEKTDRRQVLIGVGRVKKISDLTEYDMRKVGEPSWMWERPIQHSIRPVGHYDEGDGFLMPYQEIIQWVEENPEAQPVDWETYTAFTSPEHKDEFSYGSELVTHDGAIAALLSMEDKLRLIGKNFDDIDTEKQQLWIDEQLSRLWKVRGHFPGLGVVLRKFGFSRGLFIAHKLQELAGVNGDPWLQIPKIFSDPSILPSELRKDITVLKPLWESIQRNETRLKFLRLLSNFELNREQVEFLYDEDSRRKNKWDITDSEILKNPYQIFEVNQHRVHILTIDRGIFENRDVHEHEDTSLEESSEFISGKDPRRIRAFAVAALEKAALEGHTLQSVGDLVDSINSFTASPKCEVTSDLIRSYISSMKPVITSIEYENELVLQLERYRKIGELVRKNVSGRLQIRRHNVEQNWDLPLADKFGIAQSEDDKQTRKEQVQALTELAESRFSVLVGPAGTGKTAMLGVLCAQKEISKDGLLLLAPTGKARVLIQQEVKNTQPQTIAQFLNSLGHYDYSSGQYLLGCPNCATGYGTVIVDEASMLTEDMFGALINALHGMKRLILVGDQAQLPPIGAGRPFVDVVRYIDNGTGYAELTTGHRQKQTGAQGADKSSTLARWFGSKTPTVGDDEVFTSDETGYGDSSLRFVKWETSKDFPECLMKVLTEELDLKNSYDQRGFDSSLGCNSEGYFNRGEAVKEIEKWQILSPLRGMPYGVNDINRQIHKRFRSKQIKDPSYSRKIPAPMGIEQVIYGDKVINQTNRSTIICRTIESPFTKVSGYLANGEIGIAVGQWHTKKMRDKKIRINTLKVEFASQKGYTYEFNKKHFSEWGDSFLELAYALTIHKAQGSQFRKVILILPEDHRIISRELLYTALTRHQDRVIIMHQGPIGKLKNLSSGFYSETARRSTNLFTECKMLEFKQQQDTVFMQEGLIHRTSKGLAVRSKSELLIAEALDKFDVAFKYEDSLKFGDSVRYPDFTIDVFGRTVYWEHLGMLRVKRYREAWNRKLEWYKRNGILPAGDGNDAEQVLVTTRDDDKGGLDMGQIEKLIKEFCGG